MGLGRKQNWALSCRLKEVIKRRSGTKEKSKIKEARDGTNQSIMQILKLMGQAECNRWKQRRADQSSEEENIFPPFICNFY